MPVTVEMKLPDPPEGYEYTGEFAIPPQGSPYFEGGRVKHGQEGLILARPTLRKKQPWRAIHKGGYYYVDTSGAVSNMTELGYPSDYDRYNLGNYFQYRIKAEEYAKKVADLFQNNRK